MKFVDTNVFIRYFTRDDPVKAQACLDLFERVRNGEESITTSEAVITEIVYILSSRRLYALPPSDIRALLQPVLKMKGLKLPQKRVYLHALDIRINYPHLDFEDCVIAAQMTRAGIQELYSYDRGFDQVPGIQREEPAP